MQGGFYQMQGVDPGKFGPPRSPYAFGELPMMRTTNSAVRFTHFGAFAEGTAMPSQSQGLLFSLDPLHVVNGLFLLDKQITVLENGDNREVRSKRSATTGLRTEVVRRAQAAGSGGLSPTGSSR